MMKNLLKYCMEVLLIYSACMLSVLVTGDYVVEVTVVSYSNSDNRAVGLNGECCDYDPSLASDGQCTGEERCDSYFVYCLRAHGTIGMEGRCDSINMTSTVNNNGASIDFSQSTVLGLSNPLKLPGLTTAWEGGVQLYVEVMDSDVHNDTDDLVETFSHNIVASTQVLGVAAPFSSLGRYGTLLTVRIRVICADFYFGDNCELLDTVNQCTAASCSERQVCVDGTNTFTCECAAMYTGANCEFNNPCFGQDCSQRGTCRSEAPSLFTCDCEPGFTGTRCETDIDLCAGVSCTGRGQCVDLVSDYSCQCNAGYTGRDCETNIDECEGQDCGNGQCIDLVGLFRCDCVPGFTGTACEININECQSQNCDGHGVCVDGVNSFSCDCEPGYTGEDCSVVETPVPTSLLISSHPLTPVTASSHPLTPVTASSHPLTPVTASSHPLTPVTASSHPLTPVTASLHPLTPSPTPPSTSPPGASSDSINIEAVSVGVVAALLLVTLVAALILVLIIVSRRKKRKLQEITSPPIYNTVSPAVISDKQTECSQERFEMMKNEVYGLSKQDQLEPHYDYVDVGFRYTGK